MQSEWSSWGLANAGGRVVALATYLDNGDGYDLMPWLFAVVFFSSCWVLLLWSMWTGWIYHG